MKQLLSIAVMLLAVLSINAAETLKENFNTITIETSETIETSGTSETSETAQPYNISGQKLLKPQKGINIINGKKHIVKS